MVLKTIKKIPTWYLGSVFSKLASRSFPALLFPQGSSDNSRDARLYVLLPLLSSALPGVLLQPVHGDVHDAPHKVEVDNGADSIGQGGGDFTSLGIDFIFTIAENEFEDWDRNFKIKNCGFINF